MSATETDGEHGDGCELCEAARLTPWYHEDALCWVADCEACAVPMVVWRVHRTDPDEASTAVMLAHLDRVATDKWGGYWLDPDRRSIPDHWHVHARPPGRFNGWS